MLFWSRWNLRPSPGEEAACLPPYHIRAWHPWQPVTQPSHGSASETHPCLHDGGCALPFWQLEAVFYHVWIIFWRYLHCGAFQFGWLIWRHKSRLNTTDRMSKLRARALLLVPSRYPHHASVYHQVINKNHEVAKSPGEKTPSLVPMVLRYAWAISAIHISGSFTNFHDMFSHLKMICRTANVAEGGQ